MMWRKELYAHNDRYMVICVSLSLSLPVYGEKKVAVEKEEEGQQEGEKEEDE